MKNWSGILKKTLVVGLSVLSFGMISPSQYQDWYEGTSAKDVKDKPYSLADVPRDFVAAETPADPKGEFLSFMVSQAESQSIEKFGPRIAPVIENEFYSVVLPGMQTALEQFSAEYHVQMLFLFASHHIAYLRKRLINNRVEDFVFRNNKFVV